MMTDPISGAKFFLDLARTLKDWLKGHRETIREEAQDISDYLAKIAQALSDYAVALDAPEGRSAAIENRYYLEATLNNMAYTLERHVKADQLQSLLAKLADVKVHDGELIPEVSALEEGVKQLSTEERQSIIEQIHSAVGGFKAVSDILRLPT